VIHLPAPCARGATLRLFETLGPRGVRWVEDVSANHDPDPATLVCGEGLAPGVLDLMADALRAAHGARILVLSRIGAHPDARAGALRALWSLEERARGTRLPVLTLRVAPMVGPASPLWLMLASRPRLPRGGRQLLNPVCEEDVVETVARALAAPAAEGEEWAGWVEVAGPEAMSLVELAALAAEWPEDPEGDARRAWEPPLAELAEHRLAEAGPWLERFGLAPRPLAERAREWFRHALAGRAL
jgi:uncharacterized protein YbjT (DUF2867 family)